MSKKPAHKHLHTSIAATLRKGFTLFLCALFAFDSLPLYQIATAYAEEDASEVVVIDGDEVYVESTGEDDAVEAATSSDAVEGELIVVYEDDAPELDEELSVDADEVDDEVLEEVAGSADEASDPELTLEEMGVVGQEEVAPASDGEGVVTLVEIEGELTTDEAIELLEAAEGVSYVQENYTYATLAITSDPYAVESSDGSGSVEDDEGDADTLSQYYLFASGFTDAWDYVETEGSVTVATIDTGCNLEHEDLAGTVDSEHAYDVTTGLLLSESDVANNGDADGHGTLVAGIIAAEADNELGIAGASYNAGILPVKVFDDEGTCTTADIVAAYAYLDDLIDAGEVCDLRVINISLGYYADGADDADEVLHDAIADMLEEHGVITVCAGGNSTSSETCYPADFDECVSVVALDADGSLASYSDDNEYKDIAAYGEDILSTAADGDYETLTGTSAAAPQVAAALALMCAADPDLSAAEAVEALEATADELEDAGDGNVGALDADGAVASVLDAETGDGSDDDAADDDAAEVESGEHAEDADENAVMGSSTSDEETAAEESTDDDETVAEDVVEPLEDDSEEDGSEPAESWRYEDGEPVEDPSTEGGTLWGSFLSALSSAYSTWKSSYGTNYLGIVSGSTTYKVKISGVERVGIDVSKWNGTIDWDEVADSGIDFVIIRCGYGSNFTDQDDSKFLDNVEGAQEAGLDIGIYLYSYATKTSGSDSSAASEAKHVLRLLDEAGLEPEDLAYPIFLDMEDDTQASLSKSKLGDIAETFCEALEDEGYTTGIYANKNWWNNYLTDSYFDSVDYRWVARYPASASITSTGVDDTDIWQFTSNGTVSGISGDVDVNFDYNEAGSYVSAPGKPTISSASVSSTYDSVTLKWSKASNASGYYIYRSTDDSSYSKIATVTSSSTLTYTDSTVELGETYYYKVKAYRTSGSATVLGSMSSSKSVSIKPSQVTLSSVELDDEFSSITITWEALSDVTGYQIWRSVDGGSYSRIATITDSSTTSYVDNDLELNSSYSYKVRAYVTIDDATAYGSYSSVLSRATELDAVTLSSATLANSLTSVTLKWSAVDNAAGYEIYRSTDGGSSYSKIATVSDGSTVSYTHSSLSLGKTYKYKVRAYATLDSGTVYGSFSSVKSVTTKPSTVTITSASTTSSGSVKVKWNKVSNATGYVVYRSVNGGSYSKVKTITSNSTTTYNNSGVRPGRVYRYKIRAYTTSGSTTVYSSSYSSVKKATAKPATVSITSVSSSSSRQAKVKWSKVSYATGYQVAYRRSGSSTWNYVTVYTNSKNFTQLRKKGYYVKVRAFTKYNGTKYYGSWSSEKYMKVK